MRRIISIREPVQVALDNLRAYKMRSFLMLLGIILSVGTLIIVVALIEGTNRYIADKVANMGSNVFLVNRFPLITDAAEFVKATRRNPRVTWDDYLYLRDTMQTAQAVGLETRKRGQVRYGSETLDDVDVRGVTSNIGEMDVEEPERGRYISDSDNEHRTGVAMIGADLAKRFFQSVDPVGREVRIDGQPYLIVGVAKPMGTTLGQPQDSFAYIPITSFLKAYGNERSLTINVQARSAGWMERTQEEARLLMRARRHLAPGETDNFGILASASLLDLWQQLTAAIASTMVGVVSVFLVIGGVVIMNVMLASVTERTREIGIRKAMGARQNDIMMQFLVETCVMSAMGGVLGVATAFFVTGLVKAFTSVPVFVPISAIVMALAVSTAVGVFFGVYPARKAARLDPIEALRYEN